ncbi:hypothetical protein ACME8T_09230 [Morganella morganii]|uniref:gp53-like domain-containing protein n=1 Tax=Morganella morganii TaxID=582 RepID=UPI003D057951
MKSNDIPKLMPVPFGVNGPREELLETSPAGNRSASYADGFPPITMLLKQAGGRPPKGENMNQILFELANGQRWSNSGAGYKFNKAFSEAVGGYPKGAQLLSNDGTKVYVSTKDDNKTDFNTSPGPDWVTLGDYIGLGDYATKTEVGLKLDKTAVIQTTGTSTTSVMSQKSVTDELNKKFDKTGGTITGGVTIQSADDFPTLNLLGNNGDSTRIQANTSDTDYMLTIASRDSTGKIKSVARFPNKNGTVLFSGDAYTTQETDSLITSVKNTALKQAAGWHKDESTGVITQWGEVNKINDSQPYIMQFPIPFPTAVTAIVTQVISNETGVLNITPRIRTPSTTRTQFAIQHGVSEGRYYWIAKGY